MAMDVEDYRPALQAAAGHAQRWLEEVGDRPVGPRATADHLAPAFGGPLPATGLPAHQVVDELATTAEPGLMAIQSGRFFGWVMGGTLPAALAADWLVSAWDQNAGLRYATPAVAAVEEAAAAWLLELLDLPRGASVGFPTGATASNFTCLAAARSRVLRDVGWDLDGRGLGGAPPVHVLVGAERHDTVDLALRYLGLGRPTAVAADEQGRLEVAGLREALAQVPEEAPLVVCLQAGNLHSGAFDPFAEAIAAVRDRRTRGATWVHVDGAFGLWAAACPSLRYLVDGVADADSWTTDAHKTLNTPYDCGITVVRGAADLRGAMGVHTSYLVADATGAGDPLDHVPELSRRARGVPVWAALRALGSGGVARLVGGLAENARALADGLATVAGATVLNDVVYTQVCLAFEDDERTRAVTQRLLAGGEAWMSGSRWQGRDVMRISVSNAATDADDVRRSVAAVRAAASA
ncbi:aspartate aminotransferase family protein [Streptomyces sp. NP160]|uniref:pyridoxal phosphate-dependent decarboxylase family protein n=1 Tax=Streptomyces sp. NP160 TaxID=2586637 RepID=UPI00111B00F3|nr:pyridoxal-dependent decarboxylase [Streptomyces sp. NP160]TNM69647.1 aspartate aminotransferase family protein [Streptomyces sp. NP160]